MKLANLLTREQTFNNFVAINDFQNAFVLALTMDQPARLLSLFRRLTSNTALDKDSITGSQRVDEIIASLSFEDLTRLLRHVRTWNASYKTSGTAQRVLYAILKLRHHDDLREREGAPTFQPDDPKSAANTRGKRSMRELVEGLIPYTERHLHRLDRLVQESYVIDHVIGEMDDGLIDIDQDTILV
jgi:U3 small nucleolar RNA-associated protein 13